MNMTRSFCLLLILPSLSACMTGIDTDRELAAQEPPAEFASAGEPGSLTADWLDRLNDPLLSDLVREAASGNFDVARSTALVRQARAMAEAANGRQFPQGGVSGSANRNQLSENGFIPVGNVPGFDRTYSLYDIGFDVSYELDIWGRKGNTVRARLADAEAAVQNRRATLLTVMAETARTYGELRSLELQEKAMASRLASAKEKLRLAELRNKFGEAPLSESIAAAGELDALSAGLPPLQGRIRVAMFQLALLTGKPPGELIERLDGTGSLPALPDAVFAGLPSDMLKRRPDVAAAAFRFDGERQRLKVARADLFPRFFLLGSLGRQERDIDGIASGGSGRYAIGPSFSWPLFEMGTIRAQIRGADAKVDAAASAYEQAVLTALTESESALTRYARSKEAADLAEKSAARATQNADLSAELFKSGEVTKLVWLDAQMEQAIAEERLAALRGDAFRNLIAAYKALGGGWPELASN